MIPDGIPVSRIASRSARGAPEATSGARFGTPPGTGAWRPGPGGLRLAPRLVVHPDLLAARGGPDADDRLLLRGDERDRHLDGDRVDVQFLGGVHAHRGRVPDGHA